MNKLAKVLNALEAEGMKVRPVYSTAWYEISDGDNWVVLLKEKEMETYLDGSGPHLRRQLEEIRIKKQQRNTAG